jgi:hypothetical protein
MVAEKLELFDSDNKSTLLIRLEWNLWTTKLSFK